MKILTLLAFSVAALIAFLDLHGREMRRREQVWQRLCAVIDGRDCL